MESLAGYSLFNYIFNVKDRHNGNILVIADGHIVHIDFGFILQTSPGGWGFESAPFKLTQEYVDLMDGFGSHMVSYFKSLLIRGFNELAIHFDQLAVLIELMLPCKRKIRLIL